MRRAQVGDRATGSTAVVPVVPTVGTMAATPPRSSSAATASTRIRNSSSTGSVLYSSPSRRAAFSTEKLACSEARTAPSGTSSRAAASAEIVEIEAVSSMWPKARRQAEELRHPVEDEASRLVAAGPYATPSC